MPCDQVLKACQSAQENIFVSAAILTKRKIMTCFACSERKHTLRKSDLRILEVYKIWVLQKMERSRWILITRKYRLEKRKKKETC